MTPQPGDSLLMAFEHWQEAADKKACCDYSLHVDIPQWDETVKYELELLVQEKGGSILAILYSYNTSELRSLLKFPLQFRVNGHSGIRFRKTIGTDLETTWPGAESSYGEGMAESHCSNCGAVMVAVYKCRL